VGSSCVLTLTEGLGVCDGCLVPCLNGPGDVRGGDSESGGHSTAVLQTATACAGRRITALCGQVTTQPPSPPHSTAYRGGSSCTTTPSRGASSCCEFSGSWEEAAQEGSGGAEFSVPRAATRCPRLSLPWLKSFINAALLKPASLAIALALHSNPSSGSAGLFQNGTLSGAYSPPSTAPPVTPCC